MNDAKEDDLLARCIAAEAARPDDAGGQDEVRARLAVTLGVAMAAPLLAGEVAKVTSRAGWLKALLAGTWGKGLLLVGLGFGAGFATRSALPNKAPLVSVLAPSGALASAAPPSTAQQPEVKPVPEVETVDVSRLPLAEPHPTASAKTTAKAAAGDAEAERLLLETARVALRRRDGEGALALLQQHRTRFPAGQLREERDGLLVSALSLLGRKDEAARAAARFRKDYPMSLQGAATPDTDAGP
ncbi:MAG: hypothetical protein HOO96_07655 [Polyangiaceae bacterium]|nr:hypothetical protein [Polyangiaceae bacterium]